MRPAPKRNAKLSPREHPTLNVRLLALKRRIQAGPTVDRTSKLGVRCSELEVRPGVFQIPGLPAGHTILFLRIEPRTL